MALVPIRIDRTSKPPLGTPLRSDGHWTTQISSLVFLPFNELSGSKINDNQTRVYSSNADWVGGSQSFVAANSDYVDLGSSFNNITTSITLLIGIKTSAIDAMAISSRSSSSTDGIEIALGIASTPGTFAARIGASAIRPDTNNFVVGQPQVLGLLYNKARLYNIINGRLGNSVAYTSNVSASQNLMIARRGSTYATQLVDWVLICLNTALGANQIASLSNNPWQIYEPETIWVDVPVSGGTTYYASLSGSFPAASGELSKLTGKMVDGGMGSISGTLNATSVFVEPVSGNMPAPSGTLLKMTGKSVSGSMGTISGNATKHTSVTVQGNMPAPFGSVSESTTFLQAVVGVMGSISAIVAAVLNPVVSPSVKMMKIIGSAFRKIIGG